MMIFSGFRHCQHQWIIIIEVVHCRLHYNAVSPKKPHHIATLWFSKFVNNHPIYFSHTLVVQQHRVFCSRYFARNICSSSTKVVTTSWMNDFLDFKQCKGQPHSAWRIANKINFCLLWTQTKMTYQVWI